MPRGGRRAPGPRIDDDGFLTEDPHMRDCEVCTWIGSPTGSGKIPFQEPGAESIDYEVEFYASVSIAGNTVKLYDAVYMTPEEAGDACELGVIRALYAVDDEDNPKRCTIQWLWRPDQVELSEEAEAALDAGKREVFVSNTEDTHNSIDAIERYADAMHA